MTASHANDKIEKLHKRALQIIHSDYDSALNYEDLLLRDNSVTIHQRNLQFFMTEIFKTIHGLNPSFMKEFFIIIIIIIIQGAPSAMPMILGGPVTT